jgi:hypothetical protein
MGAHILARYETWIMLADPEGNEFCAVGSIIGEDIHMARQREAF